MNLITKSFPLPEIPSLIETLSCDSTLGFAKLTTNNQYEESGNAKHTWVKASFYQVHQPDALSSLQYVVQMQYTQILYQFCTIRHLVKKAIILQQVHWHNEQKRLPRAKNPKYILNEIQSRVAHLYFSFITLVTTDTRLLLNVFHYHMVFVLKASDGLSRAP